MPILNGRLNGAPSLPIAHMSFLFFDVFRVIERVVSFQDLKFKATVHHHCIYQNTYKGNKILLLHQIDNLSLITNDESIAKESFKIVGDKL